jgi:tryptophan-rich hypothetical protein
LKVLVLAGSPARQSQFQHDFHHDPLPPNQRPQFKKMLQTKWTAFQPLCKQKNFLDATVIATEPSKTRVQRVELEAVFFRFSQRIDWHYLTNSPFWRQGWV